MIRPLGMSQGALRLKVDPETKKWVVHPSLSHARLVKRSGVRGGRMIHVAPWLNQTTPLSELTREIKTIRGAIR